MVDVCVVDVVQSKILMMMMMLAIMMIMLIMAMMMTTMMTMMMMTLRWIGLPTILQLSCPPQLGFAGFSILSFLFAGFISFYFSFDIFIAGHISLVDTCMQLCTCIWICRSRSEMVARFIYLFVYLVARFICVFEFLSICVFAGLALRWVAQSFLIV